MPTWSRSSAARARACFRSIPKCVSSASRIWRPTVSTGFSDVIGSWKIIAISRPRIRRSSLSESCSRSRPSKCAVPLATRPARGRIPSSASEVTLLPQPDSPTMPSVSPAAMSNEIPLTACTVPRCVQKRTRRFSTESKGSDIRPDLFAERLDLRPPPEADPAAELRVERLTEAVADQVEAERRDHDRDPRDDREPRRDLEVLVRVRQHRAPLRPRRILVAETEEREAGHVDDRRRERQRALHDHGRDRIREDVRDEDRAPPHADRARREHEVVLPLREHRAAQEP